MEWPESSAEDASSYHYSGTTSEQSDDSTEGPRPCYLQCSRKNMRWLVGTNQFQMTVAFVILLNTVVMAFQTDIEYVAVPYPKNCVPVTDVEGPGVKACVNLWDLCNFGFLCFFMTELGLRLKAFESKRFWCGIPDDFDKLKPDGSDKPEDEAKAEAESDLWWNIFDSLIVTMAFCDMASSFVINKAPSKIVIIVRTARILRILRVLRIFKSLKQLNMLVRGLVESFGLVFWIMVLLGFILFVSAIFCTNVVGHSAHLWGEEEAEIREYWGTVTGSFVTLFQFLTQDNWAGLSRQVCEHMPGMQIFFIGFVVFGAFVILSLLTGVMADHMNEVREKYKDEEDTEETVEFEKMLDGFWSTHSSSHQVIDGEEEVDLEHFIKMFEDPKMKEELKKIRVNIDRQETESLFDALDHNMDRAVSLGDFKIGMCEIKSELSAKHVYELHSVAKQAYNKVRRRPKELAKQQWTKEAKQSIVDAEASMKKLEDRVEKFEVWLKPLVEQHEGHR